MHKRWLNMTCNKVVLCWFLITLYWTWAYGIKIKTLLKYSINLAGISVERLSQGSLLMSKFSFKKIWHLTNKQARVLQLLVVQVAEEWMVIVQQTIEITHVHIQTRTKTKPGGELTWEKWSMLLKCTLSIETQMEWDCQILRSELVGYHLLRHL